MSTRMDRMALDLEVAAADPFLASTRKQSLAFLAQQLRHDAGDWSEDKHPRSPDGKFGSGGGGSGGSGGSPDRSTRAMSPAEKSSTPRGATRSSPRTPTDPGRPVGPDASTRSVTPVAGEASSHSKDAKDAAKSAVETSSREQRAGDHLAAGVFHDAAARAHGSGEAAERHTEAKAAHVEARISASFGASDSHQKSVAAERATARAHEATAAEGKAAAPAAAAAKASAPGPTGQKAAETALAQHYKAGDRGPEWKAKAAELHEHLASNTSDDRLRAAQVARAKDLRSAAAPVAPQATGGGSITHQAIAAKLPDRGLMPVAELHKHFPGTSLADLHANLKQMRNADHISLESFEGRHGKLPPEHKAAAFSEAGREFPFVALRESGKALASSRPAAPSTSAAASAPVKPAAAPAQPKSAGAGGKPTHEQIMNLIPKRGLAPIAEIHKQFPGTDLSDIHKTLKEMRNSDKIALHTFEGRHGTLSDEHRNAQFHEGGRNFVYAARRDAAWLRADDDRDRLEELYDEIYADDDDADDPEDLSDEELAEAILARSDSAHREDAFETTAAAKKRGGSHLVAYTLALHPKRDAAGSDDPEDDEDAKDGGIDEDEEDEKDRADAEEQKCPKCGEMVVPKDGKCPSCGAAMKDSDY